MGQNGFVLAILKPEQSIKLEDLKVENTKLEAERAALSLEETELIARHRDFVSKSRKAQRELVNVLVGDEETKRIRKKAQILSNIQSKHSITLGQMDGMRAFPSFETL